MRSSVFNPDNLEATTRSLWHEQSTSWVRIHLTPGSTVLVRADAVSAWQGDITSAPVDTAEHHAQFLRLNGNGEVFLTDNARHVHLISLDNESISIAHGHLLGYDETLTSTPAEPPHGGAAVLTGTGTLAIATSGRPIVLACDEQRTIVPHDQAVAWAGALVITEEPPTPDSPGSGTTHYSMTGPGFVIVQPTPGRASA